MSASRASAPRTDPSRTHAPRALTLAALAGATLLGACSVRRPGERPGTTPGRRPAGPLDTRRDSVREERITEALRADSTMRETIARDSVREAARRDSLAREDRQTAAAPRPRRSEANPASRCGAVNFSESPPTARVQILSDGAGNYVNYVGGGTFARCEQTNSTLQADSAEYYQSAGLLVLVGNVRYAEPSRARLTSDRLTYYLREERVVPEGNVVATLPSGTTFRGPSAEYLRNVPPIRTFSRLTATGRPTVRAVGGAGTRNTRPGRPDTSITTITANTVVNEDERIVYAGGAVNIVRTDVTADADSATFDQDTEQARLLRNAVIRGRSGRPFTLTGALVDLYTRDRDLTRVKAQGSSRVVSEELDLKSDTIDLRLADGLVERAWAWGPSRAVATSPDRDVVADSIEAWLPRQKVRELRAVRRAVAQSIPDSTRIRSRERDQLRGDTIIARFDTLPAPRATVAAAPTAVRPAAGVAGVAVAAPAARTASPDADTSRTPPIRQIVALGNATSLYQIASQRGLAGRPSINYVRGRTITVDFDTNQVQRVTVVDSAQGVYLEAAEDSTAPAAARDSATARSAPAGARGGAPATPRDTRSASPGGTPAARPTAGATDRRPAPPPAPNTPTPPVALAPAAAPRPTRADA